MQLVGEGKLDLEASIESYLPELSIDGIHVYKGVDYSRQLKVYQLLPLNLGLVDCA